MEAFEAARDAALASDGTCVVKLIKEVVVAFREQLQLPRTALQAAAHGLF
jgi:hypothetical protein